MLALGCKKEVEINGPIFGENSDASCKKNGKFMRATVTANDIKPHEDLFELLIGTGTDVILVREGIRTSFLTYEKGKYKVYKYRNNNDFSTIISSYSIGHTDLLGDLYDIDESKTNFVEITEIDVIEKTVKGKFQLNFIIQDSKNKVEKKSPNKVSFTEGVFETKIN